MKSIGIGIINYNRADLLNDLIMQLHKSIGEKYFIVVADDGSIDNSAEICRAHQIPIIGNKNMGIAWNKNRALYYLMNFTDCDILILIENDCDIKDINWMTIWRQSIEKWGHINCLHPSTIKKIESGNTCTEILGGNGTFDNPYLCTKISGICIGSRRDAIEEVGYFDTRFKGYGHEHSEWTLRFRRIGLGYKEIILNNKTIKCNLMISGGVDGKDVLSSSNKTNLEENRRIMDECKADITYRHPWRTDLEKLLLLDEIKLALNKVR